MIVSYQYKLKKTPYTLGTGRECGPYQCDIHDFWQFFNRMKNEIECMVTELQDGRRFIGYWRGYDNWREFKFEPCDLNKKIKSKPVQMSLF